MTRGITDQKRVDEIQRRCCMLLDERKSWEYIGAMVQLMASKKSVFLRQGLLDLGADFEADLARAAKYIEICTKQLNEAIAVMKSGRKMSGKQAELARRLGQLTTSAEDSQQRLDALMTMKAMFDNIGMYPDLVAGAQMWDGKTEVDAVGMALERGMREAQENEAENAMGVEERLAKAEAEAARKAAEEATGSLFGGSFSVTGEELSGIKSRAISDGTFMKAPNGKPTKLTERQWLQVRTQAFKEWFGDWENDPGNASKIVDENGEPKVVYHYSPAEFTVFRKGTRGGKSGNGIYFSYKPLAKFSNMDHLYRAFVNLRNPMTKRNAPAGVLRKEGLFVVGVNDAELAKYTNVFDGVTIHNIELTVFEPNQVKSATDNRGTFDAGNADITFSTVKLDDYFLPLQEGEADIPIDRLYTLKNEPRRSVDNARRFMRMAAQGKKAKRGAVAVALAGDGSYTVVDGNATVRALAGLGAKAVRVKVVGKDTGSRLNNSAYLVQDGKPGADADGKLRTHGLDGLTGDAAVQRAFEKAEENLPTLEKLVAAAASKVGGQKMMRPANSENGLATKKPSTVTGKAKRDYEGDISCVVDLIGGTVAMPRDGDFHDAIKAIKKALPEGASIARVKKLGFQDTAPRYKDVKVSVRFANGGIGEIILVEGRINEAKFKRGGHNIYEVTRELDPYKKLNDAVFNAVNELEKLSSLVYAEGVDSAALERAKSSASKALEFLQPFLNSTKNLRLSSSVMGIIKSPASLSNFIIPDSVDSAAMPRTSLIQNITEDNIPNSGGDVNGFSASVTSQAEVKRAVRERLNEIALRDASTNEVFLQLGDEGRKLRAAGKWSQKEALEALTRVETLVNRTRALLPPKLAKLGKLNKTLAWVKVYADMVRSGEVKINESITSTPITQKFVEKMNKSRDEALLNGLSEAEAQDVLKNIGAERLNLSLAKVTDYCAARLQVLLKERSLDSIMFMARRMLQDDTMLDLERMEDELRNALLTAGESLNMRQADLLLGRIGKKRIDLLKRMVEEAYKNAFPKKQAGQRSPRGKMDADAYRMLMKMNAAMGMSAEQVNSAQTALCAQLNELNESVPDYGEKRTAMEEGLLVLGTFGNWEGMSVEKAADAAKQFLEFVQTSRTAWQAKLEDEKEYYAYLREQMGANFTIKDDPNTRSAGKQAQKPKEKTKQFADSSVTNLMNYGQLMRSAAPKLGQAFTMAQRNEMAEANANLANDNRAFENAFYCFVAAAAGSAKEAASPAKGGSGSSTRISNP